MDAYNGKNLIVPLPGYDGESRGKRRKMDESLLDESVTYLQNPIDVPINTYNLTPEHVNIEFDDVFAEPEFYREEGRAFGRILGEVVIGKAYKNMFTFIQLGLYYSLSLVVGFISAFVFAIVYAVFEVILVWVINPALKLLFIIIRVVFLINKAVVRSTLDPLFQSLSLALSQLRLQVTMNVSRRQAEEIKKQLNLSGAEMKEKTAFSVEQF